MQLAFARPRFDLAAMQFEIATMQLDFRKLAHLGSGRDDESRIASRIQGDSAFCALAQVKNAAPGTSGVQSKGSYLLKWRLLRSQRHSTWVNNDDTRTCLH